VRDCTHSATLRCISDWREGENDETSGGGGGGGGLGDVLHGSAGKGRV